MTKNIIWIDKNPKIEKQHKQIKQAPKFLLITLGMLLLILLVLGDLTSLGMFAVIAVLLLFSIRIIKKSIDGFINYKLGVQGNTLILVHLESNERKIILPHKIYHSDGCFIANNIMFGLENKYGEFAYDKASFDKYALPIIKQGKAISNKEMFLFLFRR